MRMIVGEDRAIAEWVARRIEGLDGFAKPFVAIGVADGNTPIAGFVYNDFQSAHGTMQIHAAASTPRWAQKGTIRAVLSYPFEQQRVRKLWAACPPSNERAIKLLKGVGFTQEGILAHHFGKEHAVILRMFDRDFRKKYGVGNGQVNTPTANAA